MSYNEPFEVDLILNRFQIPLYVSSSYNGDEFVPVASFSEFKFNLPWYLFFDNSKSKIESTVIEAECVRYRYESNSLSILTDLSEREDPNCSFTRDRVGPGLFVYDPFSTDFVSRSVKLPETLIDFFDSSEISPLNFGGRTVNYSQTPVFTVCRGRTLETIYSVSTGQAGTDTSNLEYYFLRDEPPSRCEFPDLSTFKEISIEGELKKCYYDTVVDSVPCQLSDKDIIFNEPVSGLIILRLIKRLNISNFRNEENMTEDSSVIYYIFAPIPITSIRLSNTKPSFHEFDINNTVNWRLTIRNLYNETRRSAVTYSIDVIDAKTKLPQEIFMNGQHSITRIYPKLNVNGQSVDIGSLTKIIGEINTISGEDGEIISTFEGVSDGEYLYISIKLD